MPLGVESHSTVESLKQFFFFNFRLLRLFYKFFLGGKGQVRLLR